VGSLTTTLQLVLLSEPVLGTWRCVGRFRKAIGKWQLFKEFEPGHRFQGRYHSHRDRRQRGETSKCMRMFNLLGGPALLVAGIMFLPTPGPSYIIIVIGLWMLAGELLILARFFDWAEVRLRRLGGWIKNRWRRWLAAVKVLVVSICAATFVYGTYSFLLGG
jgi:Putative transmembrane protein (PGPGW)